MSSHVITEESGLRIWPTHSIVAFLQQGDTVHAAFGRPPFIPDISPASLKVSDVHNDGRYRKTIAFRVPEYSLQVANQIISLLKTYIVAVYTDERGVDRVMGSPKWPAYLSVERTGGSLNVTIEGWGDAPNHRFVKTEPIY